MAEFYGSKLPSQNKSTNSRCQQTNFSQIKLYPWNPSPHTTQGFMDGFVTSSSMVSSGIVPPGTLLESLIHASNEVASLQKIPSIQARNISTMMRRIRLLSSLFEEIQETDTQLPISSILCLTELFSVVCRVKILIESVVEGSILWNLMQTEHVSNQFYTAVKEMARAIDILPLSLLNLTPDTSEQVELVHKQAKRVMLFEDSREIQIRDELVRVTAVMNQSNWKKKGIIDIKRLGDTLRAIGLKNPLQLEEEISKLEAEVEKQAGTGGLLVVSNINNLLSLISFSKTAVFSVDEHLKIRGDLRCKGPVNTCHEQTLSHSIPDEFRCPISLDLMNDPVIVSSGHTYDRDSIARWINSGHHTCPKSGQRLIHVALIPNYALRSLIQNWCQENNVPTIDSASSSDSERTASKRGSFKTAIDHISASKDVVDAIKMTAEFLVGKIATGSPEIQRQAAYELRLLAKTGMNNRRIIAEAGAIPFLVALLTSPDSSIQENAVTALLNLSIYDNNKTLIMAAGAISNIVDVLQMGKTMEAKENAAATVFSLSIIDDNKVIIGAHSRAIPALVGLLGEGTRAGKRDAATALFNLAMVNVNRATMVLAGAVPLLVELLIDDKAGITDDALAVLSLLLVCVEGLEEMRKSRNLVPLMIDLLRFGSSKGKENSVTILLGMCRDGGEEVAQRLLMNPHGIPSLQRLASNGSLRARRKADALLRILNRYCSQTS